MSLKRVRKLDEIDDPRGWIQWKGTDVCIDLHCVCGNHDHFDGEFFYYYECSACHRKYLVGENVKLHELTKDEPGTPRTSVTSSAPK